MRLFSSCLQTPEPTRTSPKGKAIVPRTTDKAKRVTLYQSVQRTDAPWKTKVRGMSAYAGTIGKGLAGEYCGGRKKSQQQGWGKKSEQLYVKYGFKPKEDCWNRVRYSKPEATMILDTKTGKKPCINLSSYNYLGFGNHDVCNKETFAAICAPGWSTPMPRTEGGSYEELMKLEQEVATFMGKEDAIVVNQGFATNSSIVPALIDHNLNGDGVLVLSDRFNHHSVVEGLKFVGCKVLIFEHNDVAMLERIIQEQLSSGKVWRKIFIFIEGLYSMEGDFGPLPEIVAIKKRYGAYLYVDEAHSFGAVGASGKGVCEHFNITPGDVDVLMGTFSKALSCAGGYVAADSATILSLRLNAPGSFFARPLAPPCVQQIRTALRELQTPDGVARLVRLKRNSNLFRNELQRNGFRVLGEPDSPIVPLLIHHPIKMVTFSRRCLDSEISVVSVGYPAVPLLMERARFTLSSNLTKEIIVDAVSKICIIGRQVGLPRNIAERPKPLQHHVQENAGFDVQWQPEPMTTFSPELAALHQAVSSNASSKAHCSYNLRGVDPFNFQGRPLQQSIEAASRALQSYGFGACNPRAFYGTTPEHLKLEQEIADYCSFRASAVYSAGSVTASSVIKSLVQAGDEIIMSPQAHFGFVTGARLTRAKVTFVDLEDMDALSTALESVQSRLPKGRRCFILTESIAENTGRAAPTPHLIALKQEYGERVVLIVDESLSFACYDEQGSDFKRLRQASDVITCSMENALGGIGGFVTGRFDVVEHQRLFGSGYLYSAATPAPAVASLRAVLGSIGSDEFNEKRASLLTNAQKLHSGLQQLSSKFQEVNAISSADSYVQHLAWVGENSDEMLLKLSTEMHDSGIAVQVVSSTLTRQESSIVKKMGGQPVEQASLRFCLHSDLSSEIVERMVCVLKSALQRLPVETKVGIVQAPLEPVVAAAVPNAPATVTVTHPAPRLVAVKQALALTTQLPTFVQGSCP